MAQKFDQTKPQNPKMKAKNRTFASGFQGWQWHLEQKPRAWLTAAVAGHVQAVAVAAEAAVAVAGR